MKQVGSPPKPTEEEVLAYFRNIFPQRRLQSRFMGGEFGENNRLHSAVDAIHNAFRQKLAKGKSIDVKKPSSKRSVAAVVAEEESLIVEGSSESDGYGGSSPLSDLTPPDFREEGLAENFENFMNFMWEKYPSYETDWGSKGFKISSVVEENEAATDDEITRRFPSMLESLRNENEAVLSDDEPTMEEAVRMNELNVGIDEAVTSSERIFSEAEALEREYRTTDITLSREDITKHFGRKLDDAAEILGVSRSTLKRACRHHNIKKWPVPKKKKDNALRVHSGNEGISHKTSYSRQEQVVGWPIPKRKKDNTPRVPGGNEGMEGTDEGDPSYSDPPPRPTTTGNSHKTSNSRQEQDVGSVTIKATHGGDTIRFGLPFLSRKTDLVKQVIKRLPLNEGSFNIKYQDEDNDWILIACDEDLEQCIGMWKGNSTIKMLVEPITNQTP